MPGLRSFADEELVLGPRQQAVENLSEIPGRSRCSSVRMTRNSLVAALFLMSEEVFLRNGALRRDS